MSEYYACTLSLMRCKLKCIVKFEICVFLLQLLFVVAVAIIVVVVAVAVVLLWQTISFLHILIVFYLPR